MTGEADTEESHGWSFGAEEVWTAPAPAVFYMWQERKRSGQWPRPGGWPDQPLAVLMQMDAMTFTENTYRYMQGAEADWSQMSKLQRELVHWMDGPAASGEFEPPSGGVK